MRPKDEFYQPPADNDRQQFEEQERHERDERLKAELLEIADEYPELIPSMICLIGAELCRRGIPQRSMKGELR